MSELAAESERDTPPAGRLVIRVKLIPAQTPPPPARPRWNRSSSLLIVGVGVALLSWLGVSLLRSPPDGPPVVGTERDTRSESKVPMSDHASGSSVASREPRPKASDGTVVTPA